MPMNTDQDIRLAALRAAMVERDYRAERGIEHIGSNGRFFELVKQYEDYIRRGIIPSDGA